MPDPIGDTPLRARLRKLKNGPGLQDRDLIERLGPGFQRMFVRPGAPADDVRRNVIKEFEHAIKILDGHRESTQQEVRDVALVNYNVAPYPGSRHDKLEDRLAWLADKEFKRCNDSIDNESIVTLSTGRNRMRDTVLPGLEAYFWKKWQQVAPGEAFPTDPFDRFNSEPTVTAGNEGEPDPLVPIQKEHPALVYLDKYIKRTEYETWFKESYDNGQRLFVLYGEAGTGKTRLAQRLGEFINTKLLASRWTLDASDEAIFERDVAQFVVAVGQAQPQDINGVNIRTHFAKWLAGSQKAAAVILDDIQSYTFTEFTPGSPHVVVMLTSKLAPPESLHAYAKEVLDLKDNEASDMATMYCPTIQPKDARRLASALGNRALAIEHACTFLRETRRPPGDLVSLVTESPAQALETVANPDDPHGRVLTKLYEQILAELDSYPNVLAVLDTFLFLNPVVVCEEHLAMCWAEGVLVQAERAVQIDEADSGDVEGIVYDGGCIWKPARFARPSTDSLLAVAGTLRHLRRFNLVREVDDRLIMHSFTHRLLADLRSNERLRVLNRILNVVFLQLHYEDWEGGRALPDEIKIWAGFHGAEVFFKDSPLADVAKLLALDSLSCLAPDLPFIAVVAYVQAAVLRAFRQHGDLFYDYLYIRVEALASAVLCALGHASAQSIVSPWLNKAAGALLAELEDGRIITQFPTSARPRLSLTLPHDQVTCKVTTNRSIIERSVRNDTEWDPLSIEESADDLVIRAEREAAEVTKRLGKLDYLQLRRVAESACEAAAVHFQRARWNDAIAALEHAAACYLKIVGDADSVRGYVDTACRLARVHLRCGDVASSVGWLSDSFQFLKNRTHVAIRGGYDYILLVLHGLRSREAAFTHLALNEWVPPEAYRTWLTAPVPEGMLDHFAINTWSHMNGSAAARRFLPEFATYMIRSAYALPCTRYHMTQLSVFEYIGSNGGPVQRSLWDYHLCVESIIQVAGTNQPASEEDMELLASLHQTSVEAARMELKRNKLQADHARKTIEERLSQAMSTFDVYQLPYWRARGLLAMLMFGLVVEKSDSWLYPYVDAFDELTERISRREWIDWLDQTAAGDRSMLWLLAY